MREERVTLSDLHRSHADFLASKSKGAPPTPSAAASGEPSAGSSRSNPSAGGMPPLTWDQLPQQHAPAAAPAAPKPSIQTRKADPAVQSILDQVAAAAHAEGEAEEQKGPGGSFGGLSSAFLAAMQDALEGMGCDLRSATIMQQLAGSSTLPNDLLPGLLDAAAATGVRDPAVLVEMVRQWQKAIEEQLALERELAQKKMRPVWRCAVCGRYGCPVAPYIESYVEV
jgi:hypothetical protein